MTDPTDADVVDLFAGPGGWDVAAHRLGLTPVGIEFEKSACATRRAAGFLTIEDDVRKYGPADFPKARGLIASPPCQTFSMAGKGAGRKALDLVLSLLDGMAVGIEPDYSHLEDDRTGLVLEPLRWALEAVALGRPFEWLAFEQVPTVLPVWQRMAEVLRGAGYRVETAVLNSEQYGVPQTRRRAILVARWGAAVSLPTPTHSRYYSRDRKRLDDGVLPWVSMAQALGWGATERPSMTVTGGGTETGGAEPFGNAARQGLRREQEDGRWVLQSNYKAGAPGQKGERTATEPAATVTSKIDRNLVMTANNRLSNAAVRSFDEPAPTITGGHDSANRQWCYERPSTTVVGSFAPDIIAAPGYRTTVSRQNAEGSVRVTLEEAAVLQSLPGHPWQGTKGQKHQQVGNMIPPLLAEAVLCAVLRLPFVPAPAA